MREKKAAKAAEELAKRERLAKDKAEAAHIISRLEERYTERQAARDAAEADKRQAIEARRPLSAPEVVRKPTETLAKIEDLVDRCTDSLLERVRSRPVSDKDMRAVGALVKAHSLLRQAQLAEKEFARENLALASDAEVRSMLFEAVNNGGQEAITQLEAVLASAKQRLLTGATP